MVLNPDHVVFSHFQLDSLWRQQFEISIHKKYIIILMLNEIDNFRKIKAVLIYIH